MSPQFLRNEVVRLLSETKIPVKVIAKSCEVSPRYVNYFAVGKHIDPGSAKTIRLYQFLSGRKVQISEVGAEA